MSASIGGWPIDGTTDAAVQAVASTPTADEDTRFVLVNHKARTQSRRVQAEFGDEHRP